MMNKLNRRSNGGGTDAIVISAGFTVVEMLISIAVVAIIASIVTSGLTSFRESAELTSASDALVGAIKNAREQTLASQNDAQYGVHFASTSATVFKGSAFASNPASYSTTTFPARVQISSISLTGSSADLVFKRLTGETDNYGTITLRLITNTAKTKTITIFASGLISVN